jgi:DNA-directed RNA polymerase subunit RPC12/RpoP
MDLVFMCPNCKQELEADASGAGTEIECPECGFGLTIPEPTPQNIKVLPAATHAPAPAERPLTLPKADTKKAKIEIRRPTPSLEVAAKGVDRRPRIKTFLRSSYPSVEAFDQAVSEFLQHCGEAHVHAVLPVGGSESGVIVYHRL